MKLQQASLTGTILFIVKMCTTSSEKCLKELTRGMTIRKHLSNSGWTTWNQIITTYSSTRTTTVPLYSDSAQLGKHSNGVLFGRYLSLSENKRRNVQECSDRVSSPEQARIHHQLFQKQAYTEEDTIFLRFPVQHEDNDDLGPCYEDGETNKSDQTIDEVVNKKAMPLASQLNRENYCNDSSDGRCSPTCTLPSKRSSLKPQPTATELGSYMPFISRVTARARMVADDGFKTKWLAHSHRQ